MDLAFTACWREEFKIRGGVCTKAARAAERHHKDAPNLQRPMTKAQQAWLVWREACRVDSYELIGGSGLASIGTGAGSK